MHTHTHTKNKPQVICLSYLKLCASACVCVCSRGKSYQNISIISKCNARNLTWKHYVCRQENRNTASQLPFLWRNGTINVIEKNRKASDSQGKFGTRKSSWDFCTGSWFAYRGDGFREWLGADWHPNSRQHRGGSSKRGCMRSKHPSAELCCISSPWLQSPSSFS